jgi:hypothetical protein
MGKAEESFLNIFDIGAGWEVADGVVDLDLVVGSTVGFIVFKCCYFVLFEELVRCVDLRTNLADVFAHITWCTGPSDGVESGLCVAHLSHWS